MEISGFTGVTGPLKHIPKFREQYFLTELKSNRFFLHRLSLSVSFSTRTCRGYSKHIKKELKCSDGIAEKNPAGGHHRSAVTNDQSFCPFFSNHDY